MTGKKEGLNNLQRKAIPIILASKTISEGVKKAGIKRETFYQWIRDPEFKAEFTGQRQEIIDLALHELKTSASDAVSVLRELLQAEGEGVRLRTALGILEHIGKFVEFEKLEGRVETLERSIKK